MHLSHTTLCKLLIGAFFILYFFNSILFIFLLFKTSNSQIKEDILEKEDKVPRKGFWKKPVEAVRNDLVRVLVFGDVSLAQYLHEDIFEKAGVDSFVDKNLHIRFNHEVYTRSTLWQYDVVVLMANGRSEDNIKRFQLWLQFLKDSKDSLSEALDEGGLNGKESDELRRVHDKFKIGVVMVGNEECNNHWLKKYLISEGGILDFVFITYRASELNDVTNVFQWPLGVAKYRGFPPIKSIRQGAWKRNYFCNFMGSIYPHSSRFSLVQDLQAYKEDHKGNESLCYIESRKKWIAAESKVSSEKYGKILHQSSFTLCPVGFNEESYRIYEAISYGSIPIVENSKNVARNLSSLAVNLCYSNLAGTENKGEVYDYKHDGEITNNVGNIQNYSKDGKIKNYEGKKIPFNHFLKKEGGYFYDSNSGIIHNLKSEHLKENHREITQYFLKKNKAPVLFADKLNVNLILQLQRRLSDDDITLWRSILTEWYRKFRRQYGDKFSDVVLGVYNEQKSKD